MSRYRIKLDIGKPAPLWLSATIGPTAFTPIEQAADNFGSLSDAQSLADGIALDHPRFKTMVQVEKVPT